MLPGGSRGDVYLGQLTLFPDWARKGGGEGAKQWLPWQFVCRAIKAHDTKYSKGVAFLLAWVPCRPFNFKVGVAQENVVCMLFINNTLILEASITWKF